MPIFQSIATSFAPYNIGQITRAADLIREEYLDLIENDLRWVDHVQRATADPAKVQYVFNTWSARLKEIMDNSPPNDSQRAFSQQLKKEMFAQDNACSLCGQEIKLLNDAALDHAKHYWRGGETVPENARLAHRHCNSSRGGN